jgi:hypothetical protein
MVARLSRWSSSASGLAPSSGRRLSASSIGCWRSRPRASAERRQSIAAFRAIAASQLIGLARRRSKRAAFSQIFR